MASPLLTEVGYYLGVLVQPTLTEIVHFLLTLLCDEISGHQKISGLALSH